MGASDRTVEEKVARIANRGHGVVTRQQLFRAGVSRREIESRLRSGMLLRAHPGVYRAGHRAPSVEATYLAAVFAAGEGAVLTGRRGRASLGARQGTGPRPRGHRYKRTTH